MGAVWTFEKIAEYHKFMASFIAGYKDKIDCADLALEGLVEFAYQNRLPVKLKYFKKGKAEYFTSPTYEAIDEAHNPHLKKAAEAGVAARVTELTSIMDRNAEKKEAFKKLVRIYLGAENVIDNTRPIEPSDALAGDFLMMQRPGGAPGHTRVIYTMTPAFNQVTQQMDYWVIWYQGNRPIEVPAKRYEYLSILVNSIEKDSGAPLVYGGKPRAWRFDSFEK